MQNYCCMAILELALMMMFADILHGNFEIALGSIVEQFPHIVPIIGYFNAQRSWNVVFFLPSDAVSFSWVVSLTTSLCSLRNLAFRYK